MPIVFCHQIGKAQGSVPSRLRSVLDAEEPKLVYFLQRLWKNQGDAVTYKELRQCILDGGEHKDLIEDWRQDYSRFVAKHMEPLYSKTIDTAMEDLKRRFPDSYRSRMDYQVARYTGEQSARFVTNCTNEQTRALRQLVRRAANMQDLSVDGLAKAIRPMIGLNERQANANMNYYQNLIDHGMPEKKALEKSLKYGERQHRYRAYMIARTELAFAYNNGEFEAVKQAMEAGIMGHTIKKWCTANDNWVDTKGERGPKDKKYGRVCGLCESLEGKELELDEPFDFKTSLPDSTRLTPPAHPHCRCSLIYIEKEPPTGRYAKPTEFATESRGTEEHAATLPQIQEAANKTDVLVRQYTDIPSKWSGKVRWRQDNHAKAGKAWNCDILVRTDANLHNLIHEHLHARSVSYFTQDTYDAYRGIEELAVEFFAREICKENDIEIEYSPAYNLVAALVYINQRLKLKDTNLAFAQQLLRIPLPDRMEWLRRQIIEHATNFAVYNELMKLWEEIDAWKGV